MNELNKKNPFKTPEGYFEGFGNRLMDKLSEEQSNIPSNEGFVVPENYFESLDQNILKKLDKKETKVISLNPYKKYYYAAASIAVIVLVTVGLRWGASDEPSFEGLANSDIDAYFENNEFGLSIYEIGEVIPVEEIQISDILENQFNDENVVDYLDDNIEDFDELNLEIDE